MALDPILWAMKDAPTADVEEWAVLSCMAESADEDGCNAFQATGTIAKRAKLSTRTVQRRIDSMLERGLIVLGDQENERLLRIPAHLRPTNYDLCIPFSWYGNIGRVNEYRETQGRAPLTPDDRPPLGPPPTKKKRADAGKTKGSNDETQAAPIVQAEQPAEERGDFKSPPDSESPHDFLSGEGVTTSRPEGRQEVTQPSPSTHPTDPPLSLPPSAANVADPAASTGSPTGSPKRKNGTRLPDDFTVTPPMVEWARDNAPDVDGRVETEKFMDYWRAKPGKDGVKLDWPATWRNWFRTAQQRAETQRATPRRGEFDWDAAMAKAEQMERHLGGGAGA